MRPRSLPLALAVLTRSRAALPPRLPVVSVFLVAFRAGLKHACAPVLVPALLAGHRQRVGPVTPLAGRHPQAGSSEGDETMCAGAVHRSDSKRSALSHCSCALSRAR